MVWATLVNRIASRQMKFNTHEILHQSPENTGPRQIQARFKWTQRFSLPLAVLKQSMRNSSEHNCIKIREIKYPQNPSTKSREHWSEANTHHIAMDQTVIASLASSKINNELYFREKNCMKTSEIKYPWNPSPKSRNHWSETNTSENTIHQTFFASNSLRSAETKSELL